jgi:hypothetical protein
MYMPSLSESATMSIRQSGSLGHQCLRHLTRAAVLAFAFHARSAVAQPNAPTQVAEIRFAVLPLPAGLRDGATVMRMDSTHHPVIVRQGWNDMVCMRVEPGEAAWDVRCYEATMARLIFRAGELVMSGLTIDSVGTRIAAEAKAGTLALPKQAASGYRALGPIDAYNPSTGEVTSQMRIWHALHVPFATAEAMGLPDESTVPIAERASTPYVVASGTWWAHVMIERPESHASTGH